ncbi:LAO/AO transport system kinase [Litorivivens lipolytica]|uniref:LAO/AO transport system kinase n=1 Tax=Litorivivens lipolytica TaxID=1524264 RepID=A0A7W4W534_9GAMM|nr:methylmalonyl Co-A mutase-associated GTPase MeaB [Litorivivens lipolytica]MBB3047646.1 LAO/AO transport system kinase [Litorivivens lipolytica]
MRRPITLDDQWRSAVQARDTAVLARTITAIERSPEFLLQLSREVFSVAPVNSIGITGVPGAGKSTLLNQLIAHYRAQDKQVAVLAVDPSSVQTGGAVLGDRLRMQDHALDDGVFVRSLSTKGQLGGVSETTFITAQFLKFAGFDRVFIETVGIGQNELDIVRVADVSALVFIPGGGDYVQGIKSGVMEVGDVFAINKADLDGVRALEKVLQLEAHDRENKTGFATTVCRTNAISGDGVPALVDALEAALGSPQASARRDSQLRAFSELLLSIELRQRWLKPFVAGDKGLEFFSALERGEKQPADIVEAFHASVRNANG